MLLNLFLLFALSAILSLVILNDLRRMRIPNMLSLVLLALFPVQAVALGEWFAILSQMGLAAVVFALGFVAFAARAMGGGDVKILAALALFAPVGFLAEIFLVFAACIFVCVPLVLGSRRFAGHEGSDWVFLTAKRFPLGLPIGLAGLIVVAAAFRTLG